MHFCGLHCIKFTVISKFQVKGLRHASAIGEIFFRMGFFKKNFSFRMDFSTIFFRLSIFWGCSFDAKIGLLSIYEVFRAIPALLHPVWSQLRISCFMNSIFFFEVEIFFRNAIFQKYFFSNGFFRLLFFRSEFFWGVDSIQKLVLFRFMKFSGRFRHSFTPVWSKFRISTFL